MKRSELALEDLFEPGRPDYPLRLTPLHKHPDRANIDPEALDKALFLAALAFHRHTMVIEQEVVGPTFAAILKKGFPARLGQNLEAPILQASVDEQYHTLMHLNAANVMRKSRPWNCTGRDIPVPRFVDVYRQRCQAAEHTWQRHLIGLAFAMVTEISIDAYLLLLAEDDEIQRFNSATARLHWRDEKCHASISSEITKVIFAELTAEQQDIFLTQMRDAVRIFSEQDFAAWNHIVDCAGIVRGRQIIAECAEIPDAHYLVRDNSGVQAIWHELNDIAGTRRSWIENEEGW